MEEIYQYCIVWLAKQNKIPLGTKSTPDKSALLIYDIKMTNVWRHFEVGVKLGSITAVGRTSHYVIDPGERIRGEINGYVLNFKCSLFAVTGC